MFIAMPDGTSRPATEEEIEQSRIRQLEYEALMRDMEKQRMRVERNSRLTRSDWVVVASLDTGVPVSDAWKAYRQALRDVPAQSGFPETIDWPVPPA